MKSTQWLFRLLLLSMCCSIFGTIPLAPKTNSIQTESFPVNIRVDASQVKGPMRPVWRMFGADEPNFAYMKDGKKLLTELGQLRPQPVGVYFRTHNLLTSGDGTPALKW